MCVCVLVLVCAFNLLDLIIPFGLITLTNTRAIVLLLFDLLSYPLVLGSANVEERFQKCRFWFREAAF